MLCHDTEDLERYFKGTGVLFSITAVGAAILMPYLGKSGQCTIGLRSCSSLTKFAILNQVKWLEWVKQLVARGFCIWDLCLWIMADCRRWWRQRMKLGSLLLQQSYLNSMSPWTIALAWFLHRFNPLQLIRDACLMPFDCTASCTKHFELAKVWSAGCRWTFNCTYTDFPHLQIRPTHESERYIVPWHKYACEGHYLLIGCSLSWWKALALEYGTSLPLRWSIFQMFPVGQRLDGLEDERRTPLRCRFDFWLFLMSFVLLQLGAFGQCIFRTFSSPVGSSLYWDVKEKQTTEQSCASCAGNPLALVSTLPICLCTSASLMQRDLHWIDSRCVCHALRIGDSLGISADSRAIYVRAVPLRQHSAVSLGHEKDTKKASEIDSDSASKYDECSKCCP